MKNLQRYEKLFSRDFSLPLVEIWLRGECTNPKGWTDQKQPFLPYQVVQRTDDTVHFYYNLQGVTWACELLAKLSRKDKNFIPKIEKTVLEKVSFIKPIYERGEAIPLLKLKRFLQELEDGWPWFEAMWLFTESEMEEKFTVLNLKNIQKLRVATELICGGADTVIRKSLIKIYPHLGHLSSVIRIEELLSDKIPSKATLAKRYKGYFFSNNQLFLTPKLRVAKELGVHFVEEKIKNKKIKQLKGSVACQGITKGYVRILMGHEQVRLLKAGEILVSPMTIPDFLPAMKKAAAFVTDEGGILCHAAIVARELKKPCIVGTKFATHILRDGDFVKVDANKGIVTFIRR
ncbi:hypothetical protein HYT17_01915 [Candidatus Microgenomates bacterium]|nr:hypothetical protein [Candidatus Microgenomates bacterium]